MSETKTAEMFRLDAADLGVGDALAFGDHREFMMRSAVAGAAAMALTGVAMNAKYTATSEGGLAASIVLC